MVLCYDSLRKLMHHGILVINEKNELLINTTQIIMLSIFKRQSPKGYILVLYNPIYISLLKWQHFRNGGQVNSYQALGTGREDETGGYGMAIKGEKKGYCGNILYLDCGRYMNPHKL